MSKLKQIINKDNAVGRFLNKLSNLFEKKYTINSNLRTYSRDGEMIKFAYEKFYYTPISDNNDPQQVLNSIRERIGFMFSTKKVNEVELLLYKNVGGYTEL